MYDHSTKNKQTKKKKKKKKQFKKVIAKNILGFR